MVRLVRGLFRLPEQRRMAADALMQAAQLILAGGIVQGIFADHHRWPQLLAVVVIWLTAGGLALWIRGRAERR